MQVGEWPEGAPSTEYSEPFIQGMLNRMVVSYFKYGLVSDAAGKIDFIESLEKRIEKYKETGNTEWLMDAANFAMIEFMFPAHPEAHFEGTDADQSPGRKVVGSEDWSVERNTEIESA